MIPLKFSYADLNLDQFQTFEEKFDILVAFLDINTIFCRLNNERIPNRENNETDVVVEILVPGGQPSYIKSILQDRIIQLRQSIVDFTENNEDYYYITETLKKFKNKCVQFIKEYDVHNTLQHNENNIRYLTPNGEGWHRLYLSELHFDANTGNEIIDHYIIRKEFFDLIAEELDTSIAEHKEISVFPKKPYIWNSENSHLEIAELLSALIHTRIVIKQREKGSTAKLVKQFYNLFGLDEALYNQKLQQIRKRIDKPSWLHELPDYIESLQKRNKSAKE